MPDEYRAAVLKFVEMHANSELMGVLPERDWIMRAPNLRRKLALTSKIRTRSATPSAGTAWRRTSASPGPRCSPTCSRARPSSTHVFTTRRGVGRHTGSSRGSSTPRRSCPSRRCAIPLRAYARTMRKIAGRSPSTSARARRRHDPDERYRCPARHGPGSPRPMVGTVMQMHGPPTIRKGQRLHGPSRQEQRAAPPGFLSIYVPRIRELGCTSPIRPCSMTRARDDGCNRADWAELKDVVTGQGRVAGAARFPARSIRRYAVGRDALLGNATAA